MQFQSIISKLRTSVLGFLPAAEMGGLPLSPTEAQHVFLARKIAHESSVFAQVYTLGVKREITSLDSDDPSSLIRSITSTNTPQMPIYPALHGSHLQRRRTTGRKALHDIRCPDCMNNGAGWFS
jgi:hypothetical protein